MRTKTVLGLCLSASVLLAGQFALAGDDDGNITSKSAMQMHLDATTGDKISSTDDAKLAAAALATRQGRAENGLVDTRGMMPASAEPARHHSDGSISIRLGTENLEYLVMTVDENGKKSLSHQKEAELTLTDSNDDKEAQ